MNKNQHNTRDIRSYLLGASSAEDAESMDELSVADSEFSELLGVAENDLIDAYVQNELSGDELRRFEEHYLASPRRREKVRFARSFQEYARQDLSGSAATEASAADSKGGVSGFLSSLRIFSGTRPAYSFGMAAAVLIVVAFGGWFAFKNLPGNVPVTEVASNIKAEKVEPIVNASPQPSASLVPAPLDSGPAPARQQPSPSAPAPDSKPAVKRPAKTVVASFVLTPPLRGTSVPTHRIPTGADLAAVRLELESEDFESYTVELKNGSSVIWRSGRIKRSKGNGAASLNIKIPANSLLPAVYTLTVTGISGSGDAEIVGDYPFRVVR
jgi:hypothetical protein